MTGIVQVGSPVHAVIKLGGEQPDNRGMIPAVSGDLSSQFHISSKTHTQFPIQWLSHSFPQGGLITQVMTLLLSILYQML